VAPTRLAPGEEVRVDGVLDEPLWERAALLGELTATEPVEGAKPARATEVRLAYDRDHLYIAWFCPARAIGSTITALMTEKYIGIGNQFVFHSPLSPDHLFSGKWFTFL
jgi:hypothetical protein